MLETSPEIALPQAALCRATAVCVPLIGIVRMALRPKPAPQFPFRMRNLSAEALYRRTWFLNGLWIAALSGVCAMSSTYLANSRWDFLRDVLIVPSDGVLFAIQRRTLLQRTFIVTIFTNVRKLVLGDKTLTLAQGLKKGELGWRWYIAMHVVVFAQLLLGRGRSAFALALRRGYGIHQAGGGPDRICRNGVVMETCDGVESRCRAGD
jgi:hypothetical protein